MCIRDRYWHGGLYSCRVTGDERFKDKPLVPVLPEEGMHHREPGGADLGGLGLAPAFEKGAADLNAVGKTPLPGEKDRIACLLYTSRCV